MGCLLCLFDPHKLHMSVLSFGATSGQNLSSLADSFLVPVKYSRRISSPKLLVSRFELIQERTEAHLHGGFPVLSSALHRVSQKEWTSQHVNHLPSSGLAGGMQAPVRKRYGWLGGSVWQRDVGVQRDYDLGYHPRRLLQILRAG